MKLNFVLALCLIVAGAVTLTAAGSTIGVAIANGKFFLDRSPVVGNANVFDGSVIDTGRAMADLSLNNGVKMRLGTESRGRIFSNQLVLEKGSGQISGFPSLW